MPAFPEVEVVGRDAEFAAITAALSDGRLLTLTGPPGVGKSALARAALRRHADANGLALVLVDCANDALDPTRLWMAAVGAGALGSARAGEALRGEVAKVVDRVGPALWLFDGCEAALQATSDLAELLGDALDEGAIVITSRRRLLVPAEATIEVKPLAVPSRSASAEEIARSPSVVLLGGGRTSAWAELGEIARRLDGLPAALALSAALLDTITPTELLVRLGGIGPSLDATLRTSWEPLDDVARGVLHTAALFHRSFSLAEFEAALPSGSDVQPVFALQDLVERSLLVADRADPTRPFRVLAPVRDFVLGARGAEPRGRAEVTAFERSLVDRAERAGDSNEAMQDLLLRCAKRRLGEDPRDPLGRRALSAITSLFIPRAASEELAALLSRMIVVEHGAAASAALRTQRARMLASLLRVDEASLEAERGVEEANRSGDIALELSALLLVAELRARAGRAEPARAALERAETLGERLGSAAQTVAVHAARVHLEWRCGSAEGAFSASVKGLALAERLDRGDASNQLRVLLGQSACAAGRREMGRAQLARALDEARTRGLMRLAASAGTSLGFERLAEEDWTGATRYFEEAAEVARLDGFARLELWAEFYLGVTSALRDGETTKLEDAALRADLDEPLFLLLPLFALLVGSAIGRSLYEDARARLADRVGESTWLAPFFACCERAARGDTQEMLRLAATLPPAFSADFDLAAKLIARASSIGDAKRGARLVVANDGSWFSAGTGARVSLRGSTTSRSLLLGLCNAHVQHARRALSLDELCAVVWPDDRSRRDALANRLYVALTRLRDKGLRDVLVRSERGWSLHPETEVELVAP
ncbi:MAG: ATP-binding protein [Polyangiaceae bacterium]